MTNSPDPLPLSTQPPPRRLGPVVAWLVILASVAYLAAGRSIQERLLRTFVPPPTTQPGAVRPPPFQFRLAARYAVGAHRLFQATGESPAPATRATAPSTTTAPSTATVPSTTQATQPAGAAAPRFDLLEPVDDAAKGSDVDRLRAAMVAGEIAGGGEALRRLDASDVPPLAGDVETLRTIYTDGPAELSAQQKDDLIRRHGWFGQLAFAYGKSADDPDRRAAVRPAVRTVVVALGSGFLALAALLAGLVLLVIGLVDWSAGRLRRAYVPPAPGEPTGPFVEAFAAYVGGLVVVSTVAALVFRGSPAAMWVVIAVIPLTFFWPALRGVRWPALCRGLGWSAGRGVFREVVAGVAGYLASLPVLACGIVASVMLQRLGGGDMSHPIVDELGRGGAGRTVRLLLLAAVWAPVVEETMFRGAFYHHLRSRLAWPVAAAVVGLIFAAVHPQGWKALPILGAIGFCFAALREWRGSVIAPAVGHAINNGFVTVMLVLMTA